MKKGIDRLVALLIVLVGVLPGYGQQVSRWVYPSSSGKLSYLTTERGDRIMDFSHAGYEGGGVALPKVKTKKVVSLVSGVTDYTAVIQKAIDEVSALPLKNGFRGAVLLAAGEFPCTGSIQISADGVVLRGTVVNGEKKSVIRMDGEKHTAIVLRNTNMSRQSFEKGTGIKVIDGYVPFGTYQLHVTDASSFKPGDIVFISKPVTKNWVEYMHMDDMWRDGKHQTWLAVGTELITERTVQQIEGNTIILKEPLADAFDRRYTNDETVVGHVSGSRLRHAGVEDLVIVSPDQAVNHTVAKYYGLRISGEDCWANNLDL